MEEHVLKMNFFKRVWTSIKDFERYEEFAAEKAIKAIKYMLIITSLFTLIITLAYTYKFYLAMEQVKSYVEQNIEDITYNDGKLNVKSEEAINITDENNVIPVVIVDTSEEADLSGYLEKIKPYNMGIVFLADF